MSGTKNAISKHCSISYPINLWTPSVVVTWHAHTQKKKIIYLTLGIGQTFFSSVYRSLSDQTTTYKMAESVTSYITWNN